MGATKGTDGAYTSDVEIQNNGDTDYLHILVLSRDSWKPLTESREVR